MEDFISHNFDKVSVLTILYVPSSKATPVHRNRKSHGLVFNCEGVMKYKFDDGRILTVEKNNIIYLPKGSNYIVECIESGSCFAINFDCDDNFILPKFIFYPKNYVNFLKLFKKCEYLWRSKKVGYYEEVLQYFFSIIFNIKTEMSIKYMPASKMSILSPAINYINENYIYENIKISKLSKMCNISEVYFRKIFKKIYGVSPLKYIRSLRLERAKELLITGHYSIGEVATLSGFFDNSYFGREFKKEFGKSPNKFIEK